MDPIYRPSLPPPNDIETPPDPQPKERCIRIKTIANIAFISLSSIFAIGLVGSSVLILSEIAVSAMATIAMVSAVSLAVLCCAKAWVHWTPHLPDPVRCIAQYIQSIVTGIFSLIALAILLPIDLEKLDPKTPEECDPHQTPILLIHGFCGSSNNWLYHIQRLKEAGFKNIFTINLGSPLKSIEEYGERIRQKVSTIKRLTGCCDLNIFGHSMGGLVGLFYNLTLANKEHINIRKIVTIGTPVNGTYLAYLASFASKAAQQMEPSSPFVQELQRLALNDDRTEYVHIGSRVDSIVVPYSSSFEGRGQHTKNILLEATSHIEFLFSDETADLLIEEL